MSDRLVLGVAATVIVFVLLWPLFVLVFKPSMRHKAKFNVVVGWYYFVGGIAAMAGSYILASQAGGGRVIFPSLIIAVGGFLIWRGLNLKRKAESTEKYNDPLI